MEKIAVFTNRDEEMCNFYECSCFRIFVKKELGFMLKKVVEFEPILPQKTATVREETEKLVGLLEECQTVAFGDITGIPYTVFDHAGLQIFSIPDDSQKTLEGIARDIDQAQQEESEKRNAAGCIEPIETETPGVYTLDLLKIQELHPDLSSKKVLLEFLQTMPFMELKLSCAHIPPWIEKDGRWKVQSTQTDKGIVALITIRQC
jgi:hypothetical protein